MPSPSFWQATLDSHTPNDPFPASAEIAVIGGGLHGVSTAYWLARMGARPVLIERGALAAGATGRNGGLMVAGTAEDYPHAIARLGHASARSIYQMTVDNHALLLLVLAEEDIEADYRDVGHVKIALGEEQWDAQQHAAALLQADGFPVEVLDRKHVQELIATPLGEEITGGMLLSHSGTVHSARLVYGLARSAQRHGARIVCETDVVAIQSNGEGLNIRTSKGTLHVRHAIVALNAWNSTLLPEIETLITPVRGQALAYEPTTPIFHTGCSVALTPTGEYWQQTSNGAIVIGGCRAVAPDKDVGMHPQSWSNGVQSAIETVLPRLFPQLPLLRVAHRWGGMMAFTPDYTPIVDRAPNLPNTWVVGGFSGHGMPFGMVVGRALADSIAQNMPSPLLAPFRINRPSLNSQHNTKD